MKKIISIFLFFGIINLLSAQNFEGSIKMQTKGMADMEALFFVKGDKILVEANTEDGKVKAISERDSKTVITFFDNKEKKYALKMGEETLQMIKEESAPISAQKNNIEIKVTKEKKIINGYNAYKVLGKDDKTEVTAWITNDLKFSLFDLFPLLKEAARQSGQTDVQEKIMEKGFVLELLSKDLASGEITEVNIEVQKQKLKDSIFEYSTDDYKVFDMTDMMGFMMDLQNDAEKMKEFEELFQMIRN